MTDTELLNWIEAEGAQCWRGRYNEGWTVQICGTGSLSPRDFVQPTRTTLREAITAAMSELQAIRKQQ